MPETPQLAKAELRQLDAGFTDTINPDKWTKVQFNPDSMKVSFANQVAPPPGGGDQNGPQAQQFVGAGTTKLAVALVFDVTQEIPQASMPEDLPDVDDVRVLTQRIAYFITPAGDPPNKPKNIFLPRCGSCGARFNSTASWSRWRRAWRCSPSKENRSAPRFRSCSRKRELRNSNSTTPTTRPA